MKLSKRTVLYVEDEETDLLLMRTAFHQAGLGPALHAVGNGQEAIDYLTGSTDRFDVAQHPLPSLVLLDLNLPLISGFEVLQWLRGRPELHDLPVVIFTSSVRQEDQQKARDLGATDYVEKPKSFAQFLGLVKNLSKRWLSPIE